MHYELDISGIIKTEKDLKKVCNQLFEKNEFTIEEIEYPIYNKKRIDTLLSKDGVLYIVEYKKILNRNAINQIFDYFYYIKEDNNFKKYKDIKLIIISASFSISDIEIAKQLKDLLSLYQFQFGHKKFMLFSVVSENHQKYLKDVQDNMFFTPGKELLGEIELGLLVKDRPKFFYKSEFVYWYNIKLFNYLRKNKYIEKLSSSQLYYYSVNKEKESSYVLKNFEHYLKTILSGYKCVPTPITTKYILENKLSDINSFNFYCLESKVDKKIKILGKRIGIVSSPNYIKEIINSGYIEKYTIGYVNFDIITKSILNSLLEENIDGLSEKDIKFLSSIQKTLSCGLSKKIRDIGMKK